MRRRYDDVDPPADLLSFDGMALGYATLAAWHAAFDQWKTARRRWAAAHGVAESELTSSIGDEPWDPAAI